MTRLLSTSLILLCFGVCALAQGTGGNESIHLKSGEILEGKLVKVDEDGLKLDLGDGIQLFIRWSYTRGDKHFELRKGVTDYKKLASVMKLADFCHEFAMDEQEAYALAAALKLEPNSKEARDRLAVLPKVEGVERPGDTDPKPVPTPDPDPKPDDPLPPPMRGMFKVWVKMTQEDSTAEKWFKDQLDTMNYKQGTEKDHEMRLEVTVKITITNNPEFMGAELYAVAAAELTWKLFRKDEKTAYAEKKHNVSDVRRDNRDEARKRSRTQVCEEAFPLIHAQMEKLR